MRHAIFHVTDIDMWAKHYEHDQKLYTTRAIFPFKTRDGLDAYAVRTRIDPKLHDVWEVIVLATPDEQIKFGPTYHPHVAIF